MKALRKALGQGWTVQEHPERPDQWVCSHVKGLYTRLSADLAKGLERRHLETAAQALHRALAHGLSGEVVLEFREWAQTPKKVHVRCIVLTGDNKQI